MYRRKIVALVLLAGLLMQTLMLVVNPLSSYDVEEDNNPIVASEKKVDDGLLSKKTINYTVERNAYPENFSFIKYLKDNPNEYSKIWEPWLTKAAIHAIVTNENGTIMAFGGGYLYDNEIHIYRWNYQTQQYEKIWDSGDGIISGDVISLAFGDTDNNKLMEVVAGSADGHIYVFEQRHIFDPITNTEHMFDLVWKSEFLGPVWEVKVYDIDLDYDPDIVAGTWNNKIYAFEYKNHSGYPFSSEHWISYKKVWESSDLGDKVYSLSCGDLNGNGLPDILVGLRNGKLVLFENNGTVIDVSGGSIPLPQDNSYKIIWEYDYSTFAPILDISIGDLDGDGIDEAAIIEMGKEAYVLDYSSEFRLIKLYYPPKSYEMETPHPVDYWMDWMIEGVNIIFFNGTLNLTEPIPDENVTPANGIRFNNTAMGGPADGKCSWFLPNETHNATAVLDFGVQEEAVGGGTAGYDFYIMFYREGGFDYKPNATAIRFFVSEDGGRYVELTDYALSISSTYTYTYFDIDPILRDNAWRHVRYLKIVVNQGYKFAVDSIKTFYIDKHLTDISSVFVTELNLDSYGRKNYVVFGTVIGKIVIFHYNETIDSYEMVYDSQEEDMYSIGDNIWSIIKIRSDTRFPYWLTYKNFTIDPGTYFIYNFDYYDMDKDGNRDLIFGTAQGDILYYHYDDGEFVQDTYAQNFLFGTINSESWFYITVRMADILDYLPSKPGTELIASFYDSTNGVWDLRIFYLSNPFEVSYNTNRSFSVKKYEQTGKLRAILDLDQISVPPTFDVKDIDGDGFKDIVLAINDNIYLLRYIGGDIELPYFVLDDGYFEGIREQLRDKKPYEPELVDFNNDGVYDLVISYWAYNGTTYFENIGTSTVPIWVEKKQLFANSLSSTNPITNFAYNGYTSSRIVKDNNKYYLLARKRGTNKFHLFEGETSGITTLALATYPLLTVINMAPLISTATRKNFGYHLLEVWSNHRDLSGWTQTIDHGDLDGDGKGEIIVGDFDNNIYIFEHLVNNTYKRAFRSNDLYYEVVTNMSPYYSEELVGLEGTFKRRIWEHARYLVADADIDHDGHLEVIVATQYNVYVFEHWRYENYFLKYKYSFLDHPLVTILMEETNGISAFAYAYDLDYNGYGEVLVAMDEFLFVLELTDNGFIETFNYLAGSFAEKFEMFLSNPAYYQLEPIYMLPGSPYTSYYDLIDVLNNTYDAFEIRAIMVADFDNNGNKEIIVGGINKSLCCRALRNGFLYSIEVQFGTYYTKWVAPSNITHKNPINVLRIDDQDYDGKMELIVGGDLGIDVFEEGDTYLRYITTVSSSPNHPFVKNNGIFNGSDGVYDNFLFADHDIVILPSGRIVVFFMSNYSQTGKSKEIYYTYSDDGGKSWSAPIVLNQLLDYGSVVPEAEFYPRVLYYDGYIHVAWYAEINVSQPTNNFSICYRLIDASNLSNKGSINIVVSTTTNFTSSISIWRRPSYSIGISYINRTNYDIYVYIRVFLWPWGWIWCKHPYAYRISFIHNPTKWYDFLDHDIAYIGDYTWIIAFKSMGYPSDQKDLIWVSTSNDTFLNWSEPQVIYDSYGKQYYPHVEYYEKEDLVIVGGMLLTTINPLEPFLVVSRNKGMSWSEPKFIYRYHGLVVEKCVYGAIKYSMYIRASWTRIGMHYTYGLKFSMNDNGEIVYSFPVDIRYYAGIWEHLYDIVVGYRSRHDWLRYKLGKVNVMEVGDTDGDARREIIASYDDMVTVFEIADNYLDYRIYDQKELLGPFNYSISCISVGDSNRNGWDEIVISTDYGNVYSYESVYSSVWKKDDLKVPRKEYMGKIFSSASGIEGYGLVNLDSDNALEYYCYDAYYIYVIDVIYSSIYYQDFYPALIFYVLYFEDSVGRGYLVVGLSNSTIILLNGTDLGVVNRITPFNGTLYDMKISGNLFAMNDSGYVVEIDVLTMSVIWTFNLDSTTSVAKAIDIIHDGEEIIGLILQLYNGTLYYVDYQTKSVLWVLNLNVTTENNFLPYDYNGDGVEEFLAMNYTDSNYVLMIISVDGAILNTLKFESYYKYRGFRLANIDNDSFVDILAYTVMGEVAISTKSFDVIWYTENYYKDYYFVSDFDGDGVSEILTSFDGGTILSNSYGIVRMYFGWPENRTYFAMGDVDNDGATEIVGFLESGYFAIIIESQFNETFSGEAYYTLDKINYRRFFDVSDDGIIVNVDINGDNSDDIVMYNGSQMVAYDVAGDYLLFRTKIDMDVREILYGDCYNEGYNASIVIYNDTHVMILDSKTGGRLFYSEIVSTPAYIIRVFVDDFKGLNYDVVMVVTSKGTYVIRQGIISVFNNIGNYTYPIAGDFDGNGVPQLAYKEYETRNLTICNENGAIAWSVILPGTSANNFSQDIFAVDYDGDLSYEIAYTKADGEIVIYNGVSGSILLTLSTGIKSIGLWVRSDTLFGASKTIAVKYAGYGLYIFNSSSDKILEFGDASTSEYIETMVKGYPYYFTWTSSKVYGIDKYGHVIYVPLSECILDISNAIIEGYRYIVALSESGKIYYMLLDSISIVDVSSRAESITGNASPSIGNIVFGLFLVPSVIGIYVLIRKKRKTKIK